MHMKSMWHSKLGLSTGQSESGLCLTLNQPDHFGSLILGPAADPPKAVVRVVGCHQFLVRSRLASECSNRRWNLQKSTEICCFFVGSDQILKRSGQISTRSQRISMRSQQISKRSGQISTRSHRISTTIMMHVTILPVSNPILRERESSFRSCSLEWGSIGDG